MKKDEFYMQKALDLAEIAASEKEVPVGCIIVNQEGEIIAGAHNKVVQNLDPSAHAEVLAIRQACQKIQNYRLEGHIIFTTLEPCTFCAGVIINARLARLVYATKEPKTGVVESVCNLFAQPWYKSKLEIRAGVLQAKSEKLLKEFFLVRR